MSKFYATYEHFHHERLPAMGAEKFKVIGTECADVVVLIIICILIY